MDSENAERELAFVKDIMQKTSQRVDAHAFHSVHWGVIVLVWYPIGNWFGQHGMMDWYIGIGVAAIILGTALSVWRGVQVNRTPRLVGGNTFISCQIARIVFANLIAGFVLSFLGPATGLIEGANVPIIWGLVYANVAFMMGVAYSRDFMISVVFIFVGTLLAMLMPQYNGYILGPFMGLGMIVPGLRAEARVRRLLSSDPILEAS